MTGEFRSPKSAFLVLNGGVDYNVTQSGQEKESSKMIVDMYKDQCVFSFCYHALHE